MISKIKEELIEIKDADTQGSLVEIKLIENVTWLLDSAFRIPYTRFRFGVDPLLSFIPMAGPLISYFISCLLIIGMIRKRPSGMLAARMIFNVVIDFLISEIPIIGNLFDFALKANSRNFNLMKKHYEKGELQGSAWPVILGVIVSLFVILIGLIAGVVAFGMLLWNYTFGLLF